MVIWMIAQQANSDLSLWLTVGLPIAIVLIAQAGALLTMHMAAKRNQTGERVRYLLTERRIAYASHIGAADRVRERMSQSLFAEMRLGEDRHDKFDALMEAQASFEAAGNEALMLASDEYIAATDTFVAAMSAAFKIHAAKSTSGWTAESPAEVVPIDEMDGFVEYSIGIAREEVIAMRNLARQEVGS